MVAISPRRTRSMKRPKKFYIKSQCESKFLTLLLHYTKFPALIVTTYLSKLRINLLFISISLLYPLQYISRLSYGTLDIYHPLFYPKFYEIPTPTAHSFLVMATVLYHANGTSRQPPSIVPVYNLYVRHQRHHQFEHSYDLHGVALYYSLSLIAPLLHYFTSLPCFPSIILLLLFSYSVLGASVLFYTILSASRRSTVLSSFYFIATEYLFHKQKIKKKAYTTNFLYCIAPFFQRHTNMPRALRSRSRTSNPANLSPGRTSVHSVDDLPRLTALPPKRRRHSTRTGMSTTRNAPISVPSAPPLSLSPKPTEPPRDPRAHPTIVCRLCLNSSTPHNILVCVSCRKGIHTFCLNPPLLNVPSVKDWKCAKCSRHRLPLKKEFYTKQTKSPSKTPNPSYTTTAATSVAPALSDTPYQQLPISKAVSITTTDPASTRATTPNSESPLTEKPTAETVSLNRNTASARASFCNSELDFRTRNQDSVPFPQSRTPESPSLVQSSHSKSRPPSAVKETPRESGPGPQSQHKFHGSSPHRTSLDNNMSTFPCRQNSPDVDTVKGNDDDLPLICSSPSRSPLRSDSLPRTPQDNAPVRHRSNSKTVSCTQKPDSDHNLDIPTLSCPEFELDDAPSLPCSTALLSRSRLERVAKSSRPLEIVPLPKSRLRPREKRLRDAMLESTCAATHTGSTPNVGRIPKRQKASLGQKLSPDLNILKDDDEVLADNDCLQSSKIFPEPTYTRDIQVPTNASHISKGFTQPASVASPTRAETKRSNPIACLGKNSLNRSNSRSIPNTNNSSRKVSGDVMSGLANDPGASLPHANDPEYGSRHFKPAALKSSSYAVVSHPLSTCIRNSAPTANYECFAKSESFVRTGDNNCTPWCGFHMDAKGEALLTLAMSQKNQHLATFGTSLASSVRVSSPKSSKTGPVETVKLQRMQMDALAASRKRHAPSFPVMELKGALATNGSIESIVQSHSTNAPCRSSVKSRHSDTPQHGVQIFASNVGSQPVASAVASSTHGSVATLTPVPPTSPPLMESGVTPIPSPCSSISKKGVENNIGTPDMPFSSVALSYPQRAFSKECGWGSAGDRHNPANRFDGALQRFNELPSGFWPRDRGMNGGSMREPGPAVRPVDKIENVKSQFCIENPATSFGQTKGINVLSELSSGIHSGADKMKPICNSDASPCPPSSLHILESGHTGKRMPQPQLPTTEPRKGSTVSRGFRTAAVVPSDGTFFDGALSLPSTNSKPSTPSTRNCGQAPVNNTFRKGVQPESIATSNWLRNQAPISPALDSKDKAFQRGKGIASVIERACSDGGNYREKVHLHIAAEERAGEDQNANELPQDGGKKERKTLMPFLSTATRRAQYEQGRALAFIDRNHCCKDQPSSLVDGAAMLHGSRKEVCSGSGAIYAGHNNGFKKASGFRANCDSLEHLRLGRFICCGELQAKRVGEEQPKKKNSQTLAPIMQQIEEQRQLGRTCMGIGESECSLMRSDQLSDSDEIRKFQPPGYTDVMDRNSLRACEKNFDCTEKRYDSFNRNHGFNNGGICCSRMGETEGYGGMRNLGGAFGTSGVRVSNSNERNALYEARGERESGNFKKVGRELWTKTSGGREFDGGHGGAGSMLGSNLPLVARFENGQFRNAGGDVNYIANKRGTSNVGIGGVGSNENTREHKPLPSIKSLQPFLS